MLSPLRLPLFSVHFYYFFSLPSIALAPFLALLLLDLIFHPRPYSVSLGPTLSHLGLIRLTLFYALFLARASRRLPTILNFAFFACLLFSPLFSLSLCPAFFFILSISYFFPSVGLFSLLLLPISRAIGDKVGGSCPSSMRLGSREKERRGEQRFVNSDPVHRT